MSSQRDGAKFTNSAGSRARKRALNHSLTAMGKSIKASFSISQDKKEAARAEGEAARTKARDGRNRAAALDYMAQRRKSNDPYQQQPKLKALKSGPVNLDAKQRASADIKGVKVPPHAKNAAGTSDRSKKSREITKGAAKGLASAVLTMVGAYNQGYGVGSGDVGKVVIGTAQKSVGRAGARSAQSNFEKARSYSSRGAARDYHAQQAKAKRGESKAAVGLIRGQVNVQRANGTTFTQQRMVREDYGKRK